MTEEQVRARRLRGRRHRRPSVRDLPEIFFCGDPHGTFDQINEAARLYSPDAMVILGDLQPPAPLHVVLEEALAYTDIWWIPGNHDTDSDEFYDRLWRSELAGHNLHGRVACVAGMRIGGLGGVFRGQIWMPDGNPNYYSPATFMRRVGQGNIWRGGVPRRHRSTIFPSVYGNLQRQKADILVTHEAPSCHKKGFCALDRLAKTMGVKWLFHGHQHEDRAYGMQGLILTRAVGYNGIVNLKGEVVVEAKLDPREEAALQATDEWRYMSDKNPIIVRDEDGHISLVPEGRECTPAILPVSKKVLAKLKAAQEEGGKTPALEEKGRKAQKSEQGGAPQGVRKQGDEEKRGRSHRSSRSRSGRDRWRRAKKPSQQQQG